MSKQSRKSIALYILTLSLLNGFVNGGDLSSLVDIDSNEEVDVTSSISPVKAFLSLGHGNERAPVNIQSRKSSAYKPSAGNIVTFGDLKRRRSTQDNTSKQPKVINNIQIIVNDNETESGDNLCKNGVCDVSVTSKLDGNGNIVTDVHLVIITKLKKQNEIPDVPVFNGFRGVENTYERPPNFNLVNRPNPRQHIYNNIPQIQTRHQDPSETWFQNRHFQRPNTAWYYHRVGQHSDAGFQGHHGYVPVKPVVDDKIAPPLSNTNPSRE